MENVQRPSDEATKNILFDLADLRYEHHNEDSDISRFKARAVKWAVDAVTDLGEVIPSDVATMVKARYASRIAARPTPHKRLCPYAGWNACSTASLVTRPRKRC